MKVEKIVKYFPSEVLTFQHYAWAMVVLDSRAIWWQGARHLVPMLDFINCKENHGQTMLRVHSTVLDDSGLFANTKAGGNFSAGEQVFENYGQPNHIYFQYHGFSLGTEDGGNSHDCLHFEFNITKDEGALIDWKQAKPILEKLYLRTRAVHSVCLKMPIAESVWMFLALKMNSFQAIEKSGAISYVTPAARGLLLVLIEDRLLQYANYSHSHEQSSKFILTEKRLLLDLSFQLAQ